MAAMSRRLPMTDAVANADHAGFDPELRIDWLDASLFGDGRRGNLGLTILPGKHGVSYRYPGRVYRRELDADLAALRAAGVGRLILLVEDAELRHWGDPAIVQRGRANQVEVIRHPIPDGRPPASVEAMQRILEDLREGRASANVAVACMGGVGRTGTVAACALVEAGLDADQAIAAVREARHPGAVETASQQQFVRRFAQARR
jgi:protein-tyrosine phosphatase